MPERPEGLPGALLGGRILNNSRNLSEAMEFLGGKKFLGKPYNLLICDSRGNSAIAEFAPGREPVFVRRPEESSWQACTNFFTSGKIPIAPQAEYLQSAYSRYGRIIHGLQTGEYSLTLEGMKELLTDVAQPGLYSDGMGGKVKTAYSQISEIANGRIHLAPGHPSESDFAEMEL